MMREKNTSNPKTKQNPPNKNTTKNQNATKGQRPIPPHLTFFPRVRTPCGHGAQVIIEGREVQSDGGEKDKENPTKHQTNQTTANQSHRPSLHHLVVFPLC